jgi:hypothetical protein
MLMIRHRRWSALPGFSETTKAKQLRLTMPQTRCSRDPNAMGHLATKLQLRQGDGTLS